MLSRNSTRRFVHVVDAAGTIIAQDDATPGNSARRVTHWRSGEDMVDRITRVVPAGQSPAAA